MTLIRPIAILLWAASILLLAITLAAAQERSLFEALFSEQPQAVEEAVEPPAEPGMDVPAELPEENPEDMPPAPAEAALPPSSSGGVRRIAVFGDSLASELARALERLYEGDSGIVVIEETDGSSGFVRDDHFDWNAALEQAVAEDSFDIAIMMIGINDRQALNGNNPLSEPWRQAYSARITEAIRTVREAGKPMIWLELPPMERSGFSADIAQISSLQRMAVFAEGAEWVETYERFAGENGGYAASGPDLSGNIVPMRRSDGIHFSTAGADKLAFYVDRALRGVSGERRQAAGGSVIEVADLLARSEAGGMLRPPFQGLGQTQLGSASDSSAQPLGPGASRAATLLTAGSVAPDPGFTLDDLMSAPAGRADAFGMAVGE